MSGAIEFYKAMVREPEKIDFIRRFKNSDKEIVLVFKFNNKTVLFNIHSGYISCSDGSTYKTKPNSELIKQIETGHRDYPPQFHKTKKEDFKDDKRHSRVLSSVDEISP